MSSDASTKPATRDLAWAYAVTGVSPDASDDAVRARFLSRLEASEFVPGAGDMSLDDPAVEDDSSHHRGRSREQPLSAQRAIAFEAILRHRAGQSGPGEASHLEHLWHREQVERFAARFFLLGVNERKAEYKRLAPLVYHLPTVYARLRGLAAGLEIDATIADRASPCIRQLARTVLAMFPLSASEHAAMEAAFYAENIASASRWSKSAEQLERKCARLAELDPSFIRRLRDWPEAVKRAAQGEKSKRAIRPQNAPAERTANASSPSTRWSSSSSGKPIAIFAFIAVAVLRLVGTMSRHEDRKPPQRYDERHVNELLSELKARRDAVSRNRPTPDVSPGDEAFDVRFEPPDAALLAKPDFELSIHDKNRLIHYGFAHEDQELELFKLVWLENNGLLEARKTWQATHRPLPKSLISEFDLIPTPQDSFAPDGEPRTSP